MRYVANSDRRGSAIAISRSQPAAALEVPVGAETALDHKTDGDRVAKGPVELWHAVKVHAVDARDERGRHEDHGRDGEYLDDLVLLDVDEAVDRVHQKIHLVEQERGVRQQGIDVAHHVAYLLDLLLVELTVAQHEGQRALRVEQTEARLAAQVLVVGDVGEQLVQILVALAQHLLARRLETGVDGFEDVGEAIALGLEQRQQYRRRIADQVWLAPCTQAEQAYGRELFLVQREQTALLEHGGGGGGGRRRGGGGGGGGGGGRAVGV